MRYFQVIGECEVADVPPGSATTEQHLEAHRALIGPLLGAHLREIGEAEYKSLIGEVKAPKAEVKLKAEPKP